MGTFDILNMRLNGYDFHVGLMAGDESWTDPRVTAVFEYWRDNILPYSQEGALGRTWQEAAQSLLNKEAAMYFLGTFAAEQFPAEEQGDLSFFAFPAVGTDFDAEMGIDAPIDGFMLSKAPANVDAAKAFLEVHEHRRRPDRLPDRQPGCRRGGRQRRRHERLHRAAEEVS